jgi:integrase
MKRSHKIDPATLSRAVYKNQFGLVRVYTRRHINGCGFAHRNQQHCACPKYIYSKSKAKDAQPLRQSASTPSFTEACGIAQKILRSFDPAEIQLAALAAGSKTNEPALGPTVEEVLTRYFTVLASRKLSPTYLEGLPAYFERRTLSGLPGTKSAGRRPALNPSLLDFLDRANVAAIDPITRMEQISSNLLDDWAASWRGNDLTCKQWRTIASGFFRWAVGRRYLDRMPMFGERQRIRRGNRCGYFTDEQYARLRETLPFCLPNNTAPSTHYAERLGAFLDLGRWGGMAIADVVRFSPAANLGANCVLTYRRKKSSQIAVVLLDAAVAKRLWSIPSEPGSSAEQPFRFTGQKERSNGNRWRDRFQALCHKAGIMQLETEIGTVRKPNPHCLRDTFAIDAITRGVSLENVAKMLGHATVEMTQRAYLFWVKKRLDYCIEDQRAALARRHTGLAPAAEEAAPRRTLLQ